MHERNHDESPQQAQGERRPKPADPARGVMRAWTLVSWIATAGLWYLPMSFVGFSKPEHNDMDPRSAAAYNHQQNVAWADMVVRVLLIPPVAALIGALVAGREPPPGRRALASGLAAFLSVVAMLAFSLYRSFANMRFTF